MSALVPTDASTAFRLAEMMSSAKLVPAHLQGKPGDCLMVIEQAMRWGMSPFAVAQCTSVISGKLMMEGKLVAAAIQSCGILAGRLEYDFSGEGDSRAITVRGTMKGETKPRELTLTLKEAKTKTDIWTKQPDQQLVYAGTRVWGRRHAPEVMLGVYSPEEMEPEKPRDTFTGTTIQGHVEPRQEPQTFPPAQQDDRSAINAAVPLTEAPRKRTFKDVLGEMATKAAQCTTQQEALLLGDDPDVALIRAKGSESVQDELKAILADAYDRCIAADSEAELIVPL